MIIASELTAFVLGGAIFTTASGVASLAFPYAPRRRGSAMDGRVFWWTIALVVTGVTGWFYANREVIGDTEAYEQILISIQATGYSTQRDWLFNILAYLLTQLLPISGALAVITMLVCLGISIGMARAAKNYVVAFAACAVLFTSFYCVGIQSNILRHGLALALLLAFLPEVLTTEYRLWPLLRAAMIVGAASGFHSSVLYIYVPCIILAHLVRFRVYLAAAIAVVATILAMGGFGFDKIPYLVDTVLLRSERYSVYIDGDYGTAQYRVGFRPDFVAFIWVFGLFGLAAWYRLHFKTEWYAKILVMYFLSAAVFFLSFNVAYSDRIGLYGFVMAPLVVCLPFLAARRLTLTGSRLLLHGAILANFVFTVIYFSKYFIR